MGQLVNQLIHALALPTTGVEREMSAFRLVEGVGDAREVGYLSGSRLRVQPLRIAILADL